MNAYYQYLNNFIEKNKKDFALLKEEPRYIGYGEAYEAENKRSKLLEELSNQITWKFGHTKPILNDISKGCEICGEGEWSCLFITGKCNARCFYCPANQENDHLPATQLLNFSNAEQYTQYIARFNFKGASISGGEPLLVAERSQSYLKTIKEKAGEDIYTWLYTNGILGNTKIFSELASAGLKEIRFDIGATGYSTDYLKKASGIVPVITVEVPAIPEDKEIFIQTIPTLVKLGVKHINLHQLRLTEFNAPKLLKRKYTYIHGERVTVLESEITALEIMDYIASNNIEIGLNYCAFQFKNRYQKAGYRKKLAMCIVYPHETITSNGYIRNISIPKDESFLSKLLTMKEDAKMWHVAGNTINIHFDILAILSKSIKKIDINYSGVILENTTDTLSQMNKDEILPGMFVSRAKSSSTISLDINEIPFFIDLINHEPIEPPSEEKLFDIWRMEYIEKGWRNYF